MKMAANGRISVGSLSLRHQTQLLKENHKMIKLQDSSNIVPLVSNKGRSTTVKNNNNNK